MSQTETGKAVAAEERTEEAKSFVCRVKAATRHKHTSEEKIRIVLEGFRREVTVNELCRREGIKPHSYYAWTKEFMEAGKERLAWDTLRDATQQEVHQLKRENVELKQLVADARVRPHTACERSPVASVPSFRRRLPGVSSLRSLYKGQGDWAKSGRRAARCGATAPSRLDGQLSS